MKRVLVTGASGFIGRACLPYLIERGFDVHAVARSNRLSLEGVTWHQADLLTMSESATLVETVEPSHLLHLGWYAVPGKYWAATENYDWVAASLGLFQSFAKQGGQRLVVAGTCAEYDWRYGWCSEHMTPTRPATPYGASKNALRELLDSLAANTGIKSAWGRVFFLYGPYEHPSRLVSSVITSLLREQPAPCSSGEQIRDFLHVSDVGGAFAALLDSDVCGNVNIGSGRPVAVREVVESLAAIIGRSDLLRLGARPLPEGDPPLLVADVRRLAAEVGFSPRYDIKAGFEDVVEWWRQTGIVR